MQTLTKTITFTRGTGLLVTTMMGTGVFVLPQLTAAIAGSGALLSWALLILAMLPVAWVFAQLGRHYPHAGGPSHFTGLVFGARQGQIIGLMFLLLMPAGAPAAIEITLQFFNVMVVLTPEQSLVLKLIFISLLVWLNWRGMQLSGSLQTLLTVFMTLLVLSLVLGHLISPLTPEAKPGYLWLTIAPAAGLAFWSFMGIETMSHLSEEYINPKRDFARSLMLGVLVVGLIYLACTWLVLTVKSPSSSLIMVDVFNRQFGQGGKWLIGFLGVFSGAAMINVYTASMSRLAYSLSGQGVLPAWFGRLNSHRVPVNSLVIICLLNAVVVVGTYLYTIPLDQLIEWTNGVFTIIYLATLLAGWRLLGPRHRPAIILGSLTCITLMISLGYSMLYGVAIWCLLTVLLGRNKALAGN